MQRGSWRRALADYERALEAGHADVALEFEALATEGVNIEMISTSEIKISVVIGLDKAEKAANAVHEKFGLGKAKA